MDYPDELYEKITVFTGDRWDTYRCRECGWEANLAGLKHGGSCKNYREPVVKYDPPSVTICTCGREMRNTGAGWTCLPRKSGGRP